MPQKSLKQVFQQTCPHVKPTRSLVISIKQIRTAFLKRNEDHLNFFSSNLLGVYPVRFRPVDAQRWFDEILEIDPEDITRQLSDVAVLKSHWRRANDPVNLSCIWLCHIIINSDLDDRAKQEGLVNTILMLQYKFISSLMAWFFKYPANEATARAAYESLSQKFEIKIYGSWQALLEHRSRMILDKSSIHYKTYRDFDNDQAIVNMISDIQNRLKGVIKKYNAVFYKVREQNLRIEASSPMAEFEEGLEILDRSRDHSDYTAYLKDIITDKPTFIRQELVDVIADALHTMKTEHLDQALSYCSDNFGRRGDKNIEKLIDEGLYHAYSFLSKNQGIMSSPNDLAEIMLRLKNLYSASRMVNPQLIEMRDLAQNIVDKSVRSRNKTALASVRTGLQLYLILRAFTKKHYQG